MGKTVTWVTLINMSNDILTNREHDSGTVSFKNNFYYVCYRTIFLFHSTLYKHRKLSKVNT